jgi:hypothetical protein
MRYTPAILTLVALLLPLSWAAWRHHANLYHRRSNRHGRPSRTRRALQWFRTLRVVHVAAGPVLSALEAPETSPYARSAA